MSNHHEGSYGYSQPVAGSYGWSAKGQKNAAPRTYVVGFHANTNATQFDQRGYRVEKTAKTWPKPQLIAAIGLALVVIFMSVPLVAGAASGKRGVLHLSQYYNTTRGVAPALGAQEQVVQEQIAAVEQPQPTPEIAPLVAQPTADRLAIARRRDNFNVAAPPSISAAKIDSVLAEYGSPAAGMGAVFYDVGVQYGIDPAYALAFFIHESGAGTKGVARFTKSIGNIRTTAGYKDYEGYRAYDSYEAGIEDFYKLIRELYIDGWGLTTPATILVRYAPWGDNNNPDSYAANVEHLVDSWQEK